MVDRLTGDMIAESIAWAEKVACRSDDQRSYPLSNRFEDDRASCGSQGPLSYARPDEGREVVPGPREVRRYAAGVPSAAGGSSWAMSDLRSK